ncbi:MAG: hypothetical protein GY953_07435 [bacterium]|nr:hypothetical protein [bacterium]
MLRWENLLEDTQTATMVRLRSAPGRNAWLWRVSLVGSMAAVLLLAAYAAFAWYHGWPMSRLGLIAIFLLLMVAGMSFRGARAASLVEAEVRDAVEGLLWNVYRAFDFKEESTVYDLLAQSVDGDLLERAYLETRSALEVRKQGGARVRVTEVEVEDVQLSESDSGRFVARGLWTVTGSVSHWGHVHQRKNRYKAQFHVAARGGAWKLTRLEIETEERI